MNPILFIIFSRNFILKKFRKKFPFPSIGVGGISLGGSGKTPLVIEIIKFLKEKNLKVSLLSRGYKRKEKKMKIFFEDSNPKVHEIGDEPFLIFKKLKIPIGVYEDRKKTAEEIIKKKNIDFFVLDDALQIKKYFFDLNIFILDEKEILKKDMFFPEGTSRDLKREIFDGDIIIINRKLKDLERYKIYFLDKRKKTYFFANYKFKGFKNYLGEKVFPSKRDFVLLVTGIANPFSLKKFVEKNFILREHLKFFDHHFYDEKDMEKILKLKDKLKCDYVITTEKDLIRMDVKEDFFIYPEIEMNIEKSFYDYLSCFIKKINTS
ncbi:MAG: tetraacyldisaccharide 4'-kinase [candidate division WOR-3 bacterium]